MVHSCPPAFDIERAQAFTAELTNESDRGAALIACDYLDHLMENLIVSRMNHNKTIAHDGQKPQMICAKLLKYLAPLSTASSRVDLAHVLGWIGPKMYADLSIIRKVRNSFAHSHRALRFTDEKIGKLCSELNSLRFLAPARFPMHRQKFLLAICFLMIQLAGLIADGQTVSVGPDPDIVGIDASASEKQA